MQIGHASSRVTYQQEFGRISYRLYDVYTQLQLPFYFTESDGSWTVSSYLVTSMNSLLRFCLGDCFHCSLCFSNISPYDKQTDHCVCS